MSTEQGPQADIKELSAKHASGEALSMEASREFSRTSRRLPPCSDICQSFRKRACLIFGTRTIHVH